MEEFFNSLEEIVQRSKSKRSENAVHMQPEKKTGQPLGRPTCTAVVRSAEWSTAAGDQFL